MLPRLKRRLNVTLLTSAAVATGMLAAVPARAETVVQIPLPGLLDARSVTTLTQGNLVVFTLPTDGGNLQNAFATKAVAMLKAKPVENALPDDGKFPANDRHPEVVLNFSNTADAASPQTHLVPLSSMFTFPVPAATYSKFYLFFNGAAGGASVTVTFVYTDGMGTPVTATIPDYYSDPPATGPVFNLAPNLAKWDKNTAINEANHHNINGVELAPVATKTLASVKVERDAKGNLVFWGATGVATSDVAVGGGGAGGAGGAGAGGVGGVAGAGGVAAGSGGMAAATAGASAGGSAGASVGGGGTSGAGGGAVAGGSATSSAGSFPITAAPESDSSCSFRVGSDSGVPCAPWLALGVVLSGHGLRRRQRARLRTPA
jgi:hypothetical protein